jgi:hypothetical protein
MFYSEYFKRYGPWKYKFVFCKIKYGDHHCGLMKQIWISVISRLHSLSAVYISTARYFHMFSSIFWEKGGGKSHSRCHNAIKFFFLFWYTWHIFYFPSTQITLLLRHIFNKEIFKACLCTQPHLVLFSRFPIDYCKAFRQNYCTYRRKTTSLKNCRSLKNYVDRPET